MGLIANISHDIFILPIINLGNLSKYNTIVVCQQLRGVAT